MITHPLSDFFLLLQLSDILLHDVRPEVTLEVGQLCGGLNVVFQSLFVNIFVVQHDPLDDAFVQHLLVPLLESLWFWNFLIRRMAVEDVVITLGGRTRPDVSHSVAELFHVVQVTWGKDFEITVLYGM